MPRNKTSGHYKNNHKRGGNNRNNCRPRHRHRQDTGYNSDEYADDVEDHESSTIICMPVSTSNDDGDANTGVNNDVNDVVNNHANQDDHNDDDLSQQPDSIPKNPLQKLQLRMWDFAQCDPKRCTGARLARRGVFRPMPLKQPFRGIVLSPNGTVSVSPEDRAILEQSVSYFMTLLLLRKKEEILVKKIEKCFEFLSTFMHQQNS